MNRNDFQKLTRLRLKEARVLLDNGCFEGAYYVAGYAIECALKACIAKKTNRYDFPDRQMAKEVFVHDPQKLVKLAGLLLDLEKATDTSKPFEVNWALVRQWSEEKRYAICIQEQEARDLYSAIASRQNGVLRWLKTWW